MEFISKVTSYIKTHNLCPHGAKLIVGVSGGADSIALLHFLHHTGYQCLVAHCNFHLREKDADDDEAFVKTIANQWHLPFFSIGFDTNAVATAKGISIEMAARELRYDWFTSLMEEQQAEAIAVAHHLDDSIETFFINLSRGTGLRGLLGIQPRQGNIIRPFLSVTRTEIDNYLSVNSLIHRTDHSNFNQLIIRNRIRHSLIPVFESFNPSFRQIMEENFTRLGELNNVTNGLIDAFREMAVVTHNGYWSIAIDQLKQQQPNIHFYLFELLNPYHFNDATVNNILANLDGESGRQFFSATHRVIKDRNQLLVVPLMPVDETKYIVPVGTSSTEIPIKLTLSDPLDANGFAIEKQKEVACIDFDKLSFPLTIRHPKEGDFFYPFGHQGKKKLSDFFIDQKWNLLEKENCWLLISDKQIVWIIGHRLDDRFKVDANTKKILKISFFGTLV
ncbi:MAG: tRNA(Ile)-lysidine synthetase [Bacteroidetes bacterium]|nr:tRNA(Ile)-lysidine synthetase [Bacteroidota bacterium]